MIDLIDDVILILGCLSSSIHGTKYSEIELASNLDLFKRTDYASKHQCRSSSVFTFIEYMKTGRSQIRKGHPSNENLTEEDFSLLQRSISTNSNIVLMKSSEYYLKLFLSSQFLKQSYVLNNAL